MAGFGDVVVGQLGFGHCQLTLNGEQVLPCFLLFAVTAAFFLGCYLEPSHVLAQKGVFLVEKGHFVLQLGLGGSLDLSDLAGVRL